MKDSMSNIPSELRELRKKENRNKLNETRHDNFYLVVRSSIICLSTPRCHVPIDNGCTQPLSRRSQRSTWVPRFLPYINHPHLWGISTTWSLSRPYKMSQSQLRIRKGDRVHTRAQCSNTCKIHKETSAITQDHKNSTTLALISLKSLSSVIAACQSVGMLLRCLDAGWKCIGVPF
jgi:hypothetical protein